jgi:hypothetical protein
MSLLKSNFHPSLEHKVIYIFRINDHEHKGLLKIGEATVHTKKNTDDLKPNSNELNYAARERIDSYTSTAGIRYDLLHTELAVLKNNKGHLKAFRDYKVHEVLKRSGIKQKFFDTNKKQNEWFKVDLETAKLAIKAVKDGKKALGQSNITEDRNPIIFRPEQRDAIDKTIKQFRKHDRMLWNAKMRFGKTLSALQVAKKMEFNRSIIVTHRPVVSEGWFEDFNKIFYDKPEYKFGSHKKGESIQNLVSNEDKFVYFASIQDLRGSSQVGGNFEKNEEIYKTNWDFIVVDEAHEGTQTDLGKSVIESLVKPYNDHKTKVLELSGTPFNILSDYEEDNIYTWDYIMEQEAKTEWPQSTFGDSNPYAELPKMNIYTYHLETSLTGFMDVEDKAFNFREFFRIWTGDIEKDGDHLPEDKSIGDFVHEDDVTSFLNLITKEDAQTNYPFSTEEYREYFRHSLWMLPGVKEAKAFSKLLKKHKVFGSGLFEIVNVAGDGDEEVDSKDALKAVQHAIGKEPDKTYSITLSCGRLTTGVSVPEWTAVLMLAGSFSTAASQYLQTIFRVQTPANINGKIKENCYVFDFAPDRTLKMVAEAVHLSARSSNSLAAEIQLGKFLNFCPIISVDDTNMKEFKVANLLQELKRAYADRVVRNGFDDIRLYNDELLKLDDIQLTEFMSLKKIIGVTKQTKKVEDITINDEGFTDEKYEEAKKIEKKPKRQLTDEEKALLEEMKEKKKNRSTAISILRGISIRIPLLVYGADIDINDDVTIDNFASLVDDLSWEEFMPKGVDKVTFDKFAKYYDKDVFLASSRRIRFISKSADELEPTERVKKIASLFASFKNPDKETVLTPWRTVNMHMSDTIGGYDFFDENHENEIDEPRFVDQGDVTKDVLLNENSNVLEINSKSGLYPLYVTYSIYKNKINNLDESEHTFENKIRLWDDTVNNNVFVICKTPMAKSITKRTLVGYRDSGVNTHYFEDLINQLKQKNKLKTFIRKVKNGASYWKVEGKKDNMKFNAIVGNPPYQIIDGGGGSSAKPVYNTFVEASTKLNPNYLSMIMPSRWFLGGKGLDSFRATMLNDRRIEKLHDYLSANDCFPSVSIEGGVCYFLWNKNYNGKCQFITHDNNGNVLDSLRYLNENESVDIVIRDDRTLEIFKKVNSVTSDTFDKLVSSRNPFNLNGVSDKDLSDNQLGYEYKLFGRFNNVRSYKWLKDINKVRKGKKLINEWKIYVSKADGAAGQIGNPVPARIIGKSEIGYPKTVCTETFLVVGPLSSKLEAENIQKYMLTKFFRFMVGIRKTKNMTKDTYKYAPVLDFSKRWTDDELYKYYGLSEEDIIFIETHIADLY